MNYLYGLIAIKEKYKIESNDCYHNKFIFYVWIASWVLTIDGLASALTIFCFIVVIKGKKALFFTAMISLILLVYALAVKFGNIKNINLYTFALWVIGRFLISTEQLFTAIMEPNKLGGIVENWNIIYDQANYVLNKLLNIDSNWEYKSYSEYLYYKLYGEKGGGASPGVILSGYLLGGIIFGPIIVFLSFLPAYLYIQSLEKKVGYIKCLVLVFIMKPAISDLPGVLSILSIALLYYLLVCIVGIIDFKYEVSRSRTSFITPTLSKKLVSPS
ncbi:hypothetical protein [Spartinivicinus poritis]|uniref:hypothetical protein n=1 Tax=Spartinivicinus poritis TaxID=2994640 RepID=UPI00237C6687|nr:hypothetical protein [Spartinivicinus sp. A2-2]